MKIKKFNESLSSGMKPEEVFCVYDRNNNEVVELYPTESESKSRADEMNREFNDELNKRVKKTLGDRSPLNITRYYSYTLAKAIDELSDYWSDYYAEHDESY